MRHLDLFSGIGGFAYAVDQTWYEETNEHIFVEWDTFCQQVLRKHWPEAEIHGDIRAFTNTHSRRRNTQSRTSSIGASRQNNNNAIASDTRPFLLTGGFPCQPFSQAGRRKGTADDRYLWPPMLECVRLFRPEWVIAENVRGLVTWNDGLVLETVCSDLEAEGYEVQPLIIPACAIGAPHRRDRVWIIAQNSFSKRGRGRLESIGQVLEGKTTKIEDARSSWKENWIEVATRLCVLDDGLSRRMVRLPDGRRITRAKWRQEVLKAYGNAIVPQVAMEIMRAMKKPKSAIRK